MRQYQGIVLFQGDSLNEYSNELGYDDDETFTINEVITDGESKYIIKSFEVEESDVVAYCQFIDED
ncbi:hypothetical protein NG799_01915 [Laspinema sp. D1]|uniref:Phage protein n=2 Tax=Laspinema TaxID=2584823 RepID=A0ABT2MK10_9CYAN|nr:MULTISPECIES: hypothetical protein [unclassified Laspinema]MCT7965088.1 hypothetical protein [Laspinema sp. D2a]MCT7977625.1 hypothetical protein [Laspinema sp. D3b]MCT7992470.1 hypothetical protein [Laspinema sp. D3c]